MMMIASSGGQLCLQGGEKTTCSYIGSRVPSMCVCVCVQKQNNNNNNNNKNKKERKGNTWRIMKLNFFVVAYLCIYTSHPFFLLLPPLIPNLFSVSLFVSPYSFISSSSSSSSSLFVIIHFKVVKIIGFDRRASTNKSGLSNIIRQPQIEEKKGKK